MEELERYTATDLRFKTDEILGKVKHNNSRLVITKNGKDIAIILSLESLEEIIDDVILKERLEVVERNKPIPLEDAIQQAKEWDEKFKIR